MYIFVRHVFRTFQSSSSDWIVRCLLCIFIIELPRLFWSLLMGLNLYIYIYIYIYIYVVHSIGFQTFFTGIYNCRRLSMLLLFILWDDWPIFMISGSKEQLQQQLEYTLLKPDCYNWWISKMQSGREDTLEERYAIKFCFKLGKMPQKCMECFILLFDHLAWIEHQFLSSIRDSRKAGSL